MKHLIRLSQNERLLVVLLWCSFGLAVFFHLLSLAEQSVAESGETPVGITLIQADGRMIVRPK